MLEDDIDYALKVSRLSLGSMPPEHKTAHQQIDAFKWKPHTWYRVYASVSVVNPIFEALVYSGFLNGSCDTPGDYSGWTASNCIDADNHLCELHYVEVKQELFTCER